MSFARWTSIGLLPLASACLTPACLTTGAAAPGPVAEEPGQSEDAVRFAIGNVDTTLPEVDAIGYDVTLEVDDRAGAESFAADVRGTFVATTALTELTLDLEGNVVEAVTVSGIPSAHRRDGSKLVVTLPAPVASGATIAWRVRLRGSLVQADGKNPNDFSSFGGFMVKQRNAEGRKIFTTLGWPSKTRRWLPLRDHPRDGAMVAFRVTFPRGYTVLANGTAAPPRDNANGTRTWRFEALTPMPTYAFHVAAYAGWTETEARSGSGVPVTSYSYARTAGATRGTVYDDVPKVLDAYETSYGKFRWGTVSFIEEPIFGGGMEHATVVSMDETLFQSPSSARKTAFHELAHHWSGDLVRIRSWNDFWLSEGFTEFLTAKAVEAVDGPDAAKLVFDGYLAQGLAADRWAGHALRPADPEIDVLTIFDAISYQKGACVVRQLERIVGKDTMTAFLRAWFDKNAFGAVTTADLEKALSAASGKDLSAYFQDVVYTAGHPDLVVSLGAVTAADAEVKVEQTQAGGPAGGYRFPLDVDLVDAAGVKRSVVVELSGKSTTVKVPIGGGFVPARVVGDPEKVVVGTVTPR